MKIAVTGKGGAGKTTVAGVLARTLAVDGRQVLAVDADPNPTLAMSVGMEPAARDRLEGVANVMLAERAAHRRAHAQPDDDHGHDDGQQPERPAVEEVVGRFTVRGPDGIALVETGRIERPSEDCLCCGTHGTTRRLFGDVDAAGRVVVADLEAGVNDLLWAAPGPDDVVVVVTQPYRKSLEVTRRTLGLCGQLDVGRVLVVANRVAVDADRHRIATALPGLDIVEVPDDPAVRAADRAGRCVLDTAPDTPAVRAIRQLAVRLVGDGAPTG